MMKVFLYLLISISLFAKIEWIYDLDKAKELSESKNIPIMAMMSSKTCPSCRYMKEKVLNQSDVYNFINENFIPLYMDVKKNKKKIPSSFKGRGLPRFYFSNSSLEVYAQHIGGIRASKFMRKIKKIKDMK